MTTKMTEMQKRLQLREQELASVKQLFVEKLKILESSFADLGDALPQLQKQQRDKLRVDLDEAQDQAFQDLTKENSALHDQINELKNSMKDFVSNEVKQKLEDQLKESLIHN